jgi:hypothetical protein
MKQWKQYSILILAIFIVANKAYCQNQNPPTKWDIFKNDIGIGINDAGTYFLTPFQIPSEQSSLTLLAIGSSIGTSIAAFDEPVRDKVISNQTETVTRIMNYSNEIGELYTPIMLSASLYGIGLFFDEPSTRVTGRLVAEAFLFSGITTTLGKSFFGRARPFVNGDAHNFEWFQLSEPQLALPSGHATIAFSMASVLSSRIDNIYASIGLYAIATSTAAARVYKDKHWLSDVMLGSAIGIASGLYVCNLEEERSNPTKSQTFRWKLSPSFNGVNLTMQW